MKRRYEEYKALREQGKTYREIAEAFGITKDAVADYCQTHGLGYTEAERTNIAKLCSHPKGFDYWKDKINLKYNNEFELISVSETNERHERLLTLKCYKCGAEKKISSITLRTNFSSGCEYCKRKAENVERQIKNLQDRLVTEKLLTKKRLKNEQIGFRFCECGALVSFHCKLCEKCKNEHIRINSRKSAKIAWRRKDIKRRAIISNREHDTDITLEKLYERDSGICYLCGRSCDWKDYKIINEAFVVGGSYPSIEHVTALCNGGTHTWDNVKLACFECNIRKGKKILSNR